MSHYRLHKKRWGNEFPFLFLLTPLAAGILLQEQLLSAINGRIWTACSMLMLCIAISLHLIKSPFHNIYGIRLISICLTVLFMGCSTGYFHDIRHDKNWYGHYLQKAKAIELRIDAPPQLKSRTVMLPAQTEKIFAEGKWQTVKGAVNLYVYKNDRMPEYRQHDRIIIPPQLTTIRSSGNPGSFDYAGYAAHNNLFHQAFLNTKDILHIPGKNIAAQPLETLRNNLIAAIRLNIRDSTTAALTEAMLLNERTMLDDTLWQAYSATGIVHIIAISGAHVVLFCQIILLLLFFLRGKQWNVLKYFIAIVFVWLYIIITGYPPSAVRAAAMFTLYAFGIMLNRQQRPINTWAASGFLLLCVCPGWLYDVGFQLSFLAVLSIMLFYQPLYRMWIPKWFLLRLLWQSLALSIAVQIIVFPLAIYYFHQFPIWVLAANIPAGLFSVLLMTGALLLLFLSVFGSCLWLGDGLSLVSKYFHELIQWMARYTPETFRSLYIDVADYWLMMLAIVLLCRYFFYRKNILLFSGLGAISLLVLSFILQDIRALQQQQIVVYNVTRQSLIEIYTGKSAKLYGADEDTLDQKTRSYYLLPSRLMHRTRRVIDPEIKNAPVWKIRGRSVLWWNENLHIKPGSVFPVDCLIVSNSAAFNPEIWQQTFQPSLIILDGSLPRWKAQHWKNTLTQNGTRVHWVQEDDAWIWGY